LKSDILIKKLPQRYIIQQRKICSKKCPSQTKQKKSETNIFFSKNMPSIFFFFSASHYIILPSFSSFVFFFATLFLLSFSSSFVNAAYFVNCTAPLEDIFDPVNGIIIIDAARLIIYPCPKIVIRNVHVRRLQVETRSSPIIQNLTIVDSTFSESVSIFRVIFFNFQQLPLTQRLFSPLTSSSDKNRASKTGLVLRNVTISDKMAENEGADGILFADFKFLPSTDFITNQTKLGYTLNKGTIPPSDVLTSTLLKSSDWALNFEKFSGFGFDKRRDFTSSKEFYQPWWSTMTEDEINNVISRNFLDEVIIENCKFSTSRAINRYVNYVVKIVAIRNWGMLIIRNNTFQSQSNLLAFTGGSHLGSIQIVNNQFLTDDSHCAGPEDGMKCMSNEQLATMNDLTTGRSASSHIVFLGFNNYSIELLISLRGAAKTELKNLTSCIVVQHNNFSVNSVVKFNPYRHRFIELRDVTFGQQQVFEHGGGLLIRYNLFRSRVVPRSLVAQILGPEALGMNWTRVFNFSSNTIDTIYNTASSSVQLDDCSYLSEGFLVLNNTATLVCNPSERCAGARLVSIYYNIEHVREVRLDDNTLSLNNIRLGVAVFNIDPFEFFTTGYLVQINDLDGVDLFSVSRNKVISHMIADASRLITRQLVQLTGYVALKNINSIEFNDNYLYFTGVAQHISLCSVDPKSFQNVKSFSVLRNDADFSQLAIIKQSGLLSLIKFVTPLVPYLVPEEFAAGLAWLVPGKLCLVLLGGEGVNGKLLVKENNLTLQLPSSSENVKASLVFAAGSYTKSQNDPLTSNLPAFNRNYVIHIDNNKFTVLPPSPSDIATAKRSNNFSASTGISLLTLGPIRDENAMMQGVIVINNFLDSRLAGGTVKVVFFFANLTIVDTALIQSNTILCRGRTDESPTTSILSSSVDFGSFYYTQLPAPFAIEEMTVQYPRRNALVVVGAGTLGIALVISNNTFISEQQLGITSLIACNSPSTTRTCFGQGTAISMNNNFFSSSGTNPNCIINSMTSRCSTRIFDMSPVDFAAISHFIFSKSTITIQNSQQENCVICFSNKTFSQIPPIDAFPVVAGILIFENNVTFVNNVGPSSFFSVTSDSKTTAIPESITVFVIGITDNNFVSTSSLSLTNTTALRFTVPNSLFSGSIDFSRNKLTDFSSFLEVTADNDVASATATTNLNLDIFNNTLRILKTATKPPQEYAVVVDLKSKSSSNQQQQQIFNFNSFANPTCNRIEFWDQKTVIDPDFSALVSNSLVAYYNSTNCENYTKRMIEGYYYSMQPSDSPPSKPTISKNLALAADVTLPIAMVASASAAAVVPSMGFGIARQQAMLGFIQNIRGGDCSEVSEEDAESIPIADSPTRLEIGDSLARGFVGAAVGNTILLLVFLLLGMLAGFFYLRFMSSSSTKIFAVFARCHVAMILFVVMSLLFSSTLKFGLISLVVPSVSLGHKVLAAIFGIVIFPFISLFYTTWAIFIRSKQEKYIKFPPSSTERKSLFERIFTFWFEGPGEWRLPSKNSPKGRKITENDLLNFDAATPVIDGFQGNAGWFAAVEMAVQIGLSLSEFIPKLVPAEKSCVTQSIILLIVLAVYLLLCLFFRPFQDLFNRVSIPIVTAIQIVVVALAIAFGEHQPEFVVTLAMLAVSMQSLAALLTLLFSLAPLFKQFLKIYKRVANRIARNKTEEKKNNKSGIQQSSSAFSFLTNVQDWMLDEDDDDERGNKKNDEENSVVLRTHRGSRRTVVEEKNDQTPRKRGNSSSPNNNNARQKSSSVNAVPSASPRISANRGNSISRKTLQESKNERNNNNRKRSRREQSSSKFVEL
jgi:hypothetical protein